MAQLPYGVQGEDPETPPTPQILSHGNDDRNAIDPRNAEDQNPDPDGLVTTGTGQSLITEETYGGGGGGSGSGGGSGGSGGGGSGGGGTSGGKYDGPGKDYNDEDDKARFFGVGGHPEVWKDTDTGQTFLVHFMNEVDPPVPLLYEVGGFDQSAGEVDTLEAFFGEGNKVVFDKEFTRKEMDSTGAVRFGTTNNLSASEGDPWVGFLDRIERAAEVSPWMNDDEILSLIGGAYLENRELEEWELQTTDWWQGHTEGERSWLQLQMADPAQAAQKMADDAAYVASLFDKIGAEGNDPELLKWISNKYTTGEWTQTELATQVEAVTSGWSQVDEELQTFIDNQGIGVATTSQDHETVRNLWSTWLGPAYAPTDSQVAEWATKIRNTGDGEDELVAMLSGQRMSLFPMYENERLTYEDIAGPWRNISTTMWGQAPDETDAMFQNILRMNDYGEATKLLRTEGLNQNIGKVWEDATRTFRTDQSTNVRRAM